MKNNSNMNHNKPVIQCRIPILSSTSNYVVNSRVDSNKVVTGNVDTAFDNCYAVLVEGGSILQIKPNLEL